MWNALRSPELIKDATTEVATAMFAVAVLVLSAAATIAALVEEGDPVLVAQSNALTYSSGIATDGQQGVDLSLPQRQITGVLGGALLVTIVSSVSLAGVFWVLVRFMTDAPVTYSMALTTVSATALIGVIDVAVAVGLHSATSTLRVGLHLGVVVDPVENPALFSWLQRLSVGSLWQYLVIGIGLSTWGGLHKRFGIVTGGIVWGVVAVVMGGIALVTWVVNLAAP
jgi:hypothetical protein